MVIIYCLVSASLKKSLVTATTTRRKQQQEMICKALLAEEDRKRVGRENFPITTVSVTQLASNEPALHSSVEEQEEGRGGTCWNVETFFCYVYTNVMVLVFVVCECF